MRRCFSKMMPMAMAMGMAVMIAVALPAQRGGRFERPQPGERSEQAERGERPMRQGGGDRAELRERLQRRIEDLRERLRQRFSLRGPGGEGRPMPRGQRDGDQERPHGPGHMRRGAPWIVRRAMLHRAAMQRGGGRSFGPRGGVEGRRAEMGRGGHPRPAEAFERAPREAGRKAKNAKKAKNGKRGERGERRVAV